MAPRADILLVEDEPDIIDFIERVLHRAGYHVRTVTDGAAALTAITNQHPDIIILDLVLPIMSGWAVLEQLRYHQRSIPVIVMTANPGAATGLIAHDIQHCLIKPFVIAELLDAVVAAQLPRH